MWGKVRRVCNEKKMNECRVNIIKAGGGTNDEVPGERDR